MLEIRITAPELAEAINRLAAAMSNREMGSQIAEGLAVLAKDSQSGTPNGATATNTTYVSAEAPVPAQEEIPVEVPVVPVVPTAYVPRPTAQAPQYTLDAIAKAGSALVDAGRINEVTALLAKYGVEILTALDPSKYGEFATDLRALGAQI